MIGHGDGEATQRDELWPTNYGMSKLPTCGKWESVPAAVHADVLNSSTSIKLKFKGSCPKYEASKHFIIGFL